MQVIEKIGKLRALVKAVYGKAEQKRQHADNSRDTLSPFFFAFYVLYTVSHIITAQ